MHRKLLKLCPPSHDGIVSISILAGHLHVSPWALYKWVKRGRVPAGRVPELIRLQERAFGRVRVTDAQLNPLYKRKKSC